MRNLMRTYMIVGVNIASATTERTAFTPLSLLEWFPPSTLLWCSFLMDMRDSIGGRYGIFLHNKVEAFSGWEGR